MPIDESEELDTMASGIADLSVEEPKTSCWICHRECMPGERYCDCDDASHFHFLHVECLAKAARTKNQEKYGNDDELLLESKDDYTTLRASFDDPWLKCSKCCALYRGTVAKAIAEQYAMQYCDEPRGSFRRTIAFIALAKTEMRILESKHRTTRPFEILYILRKELDDHGCSLLVRSFKDELERDIKFRMEDAKRLFPNKITPKPADSSCWICLDDIDGEETSVRTNCACRGSGLGFAHIKCVRAYAEEKNKSTLLQLMENRQSVPIEPLPPGLQPELRGYMQRQNMERLFSKPWTMCPTCKQEYNGDFAVSLAETFYHSCESLPYMDIRQRASFMALGMSYYAEGRNDKAISLIVKGLETIRSLGGRPVTQLGDRLYLAPKGFETLGIDEMHCWSCLYYLYTAKKDLKMAKDCLRNMRNMGCESLYPIDGGADPSCHISIDKLLDDSESTSDQVVRYRATLNHTISVHGLDSPKVISDKFNLAKCLAEDSQYSEAIALSAQALSDATRIIGEDHPKTQEIRKYFMYLLGCFQAARKSSEKEEQKDTIGGIPTEATVLSNDPVLDGKTVKVLRYHKDGKKLVIEFVDTENIKQKVVKVYPSKIVLTKATVIMPNDILGVVLNFDKTSKEYSVGHWRTDGRVVCTQHKQDELVVCFRNVHLKEDLEANGKLRRRFHYKDTLSMP